MSAPEDTDEEKLYPAYSGLDRVANIKGVPLIAGLMVFCGSLFTGMFGGMFLGPGGLLLALIGVPVLLYFRFVCETDDQALRIVWFEILCILDRRNASLFGGTYTLSPIRYGRRLTDWRKHFQRLARPSFQDARTERDEQPLLDMSTSPRG